MDEYEEGLTHSDSINVITYYIKKLSGTKGNISVLTLSCFFSFSYSMLPMQDVIIIIIVTCMFYLNVFGVRR